MSRVTRCHYAKLAGKSRAYIGRLVRDGRIHMDDDELIDVDEANAIMGFSAIPPESDIPRAKRGKKAPPLKAKEKTTKPATTRGAVVATLDPQKPTKGENASQKFARCRAEKMEADAALRMLELQKAEGKLVSREEIKLQAFEEGRRVRNAILLIADREAGTLASITNPRKMRTVLREILNTTLIDACRT